MNFGQALEMCKAGRRIAREGWNGNFIRPFAPTTRDPIIYDELCYILLDTGEIAICDAEDFELVTIPFADGNGIKKWYLDGGGYPCVQMTKDGERKNFRLHQIVWPEVAAPDHANGNKLDNRRRNLREATTSQNNANRASVTGSSSRFKGVTWDKSRNKWMAAINCKTLGRFDVEEDAARAYDKAAIEAYGDFARLNFPKKEVGAYVYLERGKIDERNLPKFANNIGGVSVDLFEWCGRGEPTRNPCFVMVTPVGIQVPGWLASQTDMIAEDWTVLEEPVPFRDDG